MPIAGSMRRKAVADTWDLNRNAGVKRTACGEKRARAGARAKPETRALVGADQIRNRNAGEFPRAGKRPQARETKAASCFRAWRTANALARSDVPRICDGSSRNFQRNSDGVRSRIGRNSAPVYPGIAAG